MKKLTIGVIASFVMVAVGILSYTIADNVVNGEEETEEVAEVTIEEDFEEVDLDELVDEGEVEEIVSEDMSVGEADSDFREEIGSIHSVLNRIVGHGSISGYDETVVENSDMYWDRSENELEEVAERIENMIPKVENGVLRYDLEAFVEITTSCSRRT